MLRTTNNEQDRMPSVQKLNLSNPFSTRYKEMVVFSQQHWIIPECAFISTTKSGLNRCETRDHPLELGRISNHARTNHWKLSCKREGYWHRIEFYAGVLHHFDRPKVWALDRKPFGKMRVTKATDGYGKNRMMKITLKRFMLLNEFIDLDQPEKVYLSRKLCMDLKQLQEHGYENFPNFLMSKRL
ncbi:hypothetical protein Tco_0282757 [Tanacetum coccineum]